MGLNYRHMSGLQACIVDQLKAVIARLFLNHHTAEHTIPSWIREFKPPFILYFLVGSCFVVLYIANPDCCKNS